VKRVVTFLRALAAIPVGLFAATAIILLATRAVAGRRGVPVDLSLIAQAIILSGWVVGTALGCWLTQRIGRAHASTVIVCGWLFWMVWGSPGVRPGALSLRVACAIAVGAVSLAISIADRIREPETARATNLPLSGGAA
jgi:hypothetical protein